MSRKRASKIETASTSFARWRAMLGITQQEAADRLGKSRRAVVAYETNPPAKVDYGTRVVMQIIAHGKQPVPEPWPEQ